MEVILGIICVMLIGALVYKDFVHSKERTDLAKISKVSDVRDLQYVFPDKEEKETEAVQHLVSIEDIPETIEDDMKEK